jgi:MipA family protein
MPSIRGSLAGLLMALMAVPATAQIVDEGTSEAAADPSPLSPDLSFGRGNRPDRAILFSLFLGAESSPAYFGSDEYEVGPSFRAGVAQLRFGAIDYGTSELRNDPRRRPQGFGYGLSFRYVGKRDSGEYDEIDGLDDIDPTLEVGFAAGYAWSSFEAIADARYGFGGSNAWVGELRANYVARPADRLAIRVGPRLLFGSENYTDTYFGISAEESERSGLEAFDPDGGLVSAGLEAVATYRLADTWWLEGGVKWMHFQGDAADSPIVESDASGAPEIRIGIRRAFAIRF